LESLSDLLLIEHVCVPWKLLPDGGGWGGGSAAAKFTTSAPSTNVPMHCKHCNKVVWRYHMLQHWDGCNEMPDNYQLDQNDRQVLCISKQEFAKLAVC
jgi:hypothetical protein